MGTSYTDLPENEKEPDRIEADKYLPIITSAKAEGYQEGVKAMGEAMKSRYYNPPNASEAVKYVTKNVHSNVDLIANQLLNSQGEERE
jgi:hypothetical protein